MRKFILVMMFGFVLLSCTENPSLDSTWNNLASAIESTNQASRLLNSGPSPSIIPKNQRVRRTEK